MKKKKKWKKAGLHLWNILNFLLHIFLLKKEYIPRGWFLKCCIQKVGSIYYNMYPWLSRSIDYRCRYRYNICLQDVLYTLINFDLLIRLLIKQLFSSLLIDMSGDFFYFQHDCFPTNFCNPILTDIHSPPKEKRRVYHHHYHSTLVSLLYFFTNQYTMTFSTTLPTVN